MNQLQIGRELVDIGVEGTSPYLKLRRWDNECSIDLQFNLLALSPAVVGNSLIAENTNYKLEFKTAPVKPPFNEMGGLDILITLKKKPPINQIAFSYNGRLVSVHPQPPLTQEHTVGKVHGTTGKIIASVTDTDVCDSLGKVLVHRPDYVVNSLAFCHSQQAGDYTALGGKNYKTGQIGYLYRMKAIDALGNWTWADWGLSGSSIALTIKQTFLNAATYPVVITPVSDTFGYTTHGASSVGANPNYIVWWSGTYTPASAGTGVSMTVYCKYYDAYGSVYMSLYNSSKVPITNGQCSALIVTDTIIERTATFASAPTIATSAYLLMVNHTSSLADYYYTSTSPTAYYKDSAGGTWPNPISGESDWGGNYKMSIWCTYTPAAGGVPRQMDYYMRRRRN